MRTLWNVTSFLAVVHLLALAGVAGWLWQSDRLDRERVQAVREILAPTRAEQAAAEAAAEKEAAAARAAAEAEARRADPALTSAAEIRETTERERRARQLVDRMRAEQAQLLATLESREAELRAMRKTLEDERTAWEAAVRAERERMEDEQFAKSVALLAVQPPKLAKQRLEQLVREGKADEAVAYLDAMSTRAAGKILREFKTDADNALATELLERIRTLGLAAEQEPDPSDAPDVASAADDT